MNTEEVTYTKEELELLNSGRAYRLMLSKKQVDVPAILRTLKYEKRKKELQIELIKMQNWVVTRNKRIMILFEGREMAGKGSAILEFAEHLNPRNMRIVALPKPSVIQKRQWYFKRYIQEFPLPGEIVFFDRSWYNRAMIEPVNGFCSKSKYNKFMSEVNPFEEMIMNDGIILIKFYFSISKKEQAKRLKEVKDNPLKKWRISQVDLKALDYWDKYTEYKEKMFEVTDRNNSPWIKIEADDAYQARILAMEYVLSQVMYK
jgi:polyphosphate kinase 2